MKILTLLSLLLLIGCDPLTPEQIAQKEAQIKASADFVSKKLPEGCNLGYAGELDIKSRNVPVVYVDCKGATTVNTLYSSGKSSYANAVVKIKQLNETIENALEEKQKLEKLSPEDKKILGIQ